MKTYELSYIISPGLKIEEASGLSSEITALIQKEGGLIVKETTPNPRTLSYHIKKQGAGFQVNLEFSMEPEKLQAIEQRMEKEEKILRHVLVAKKAPRREKERKERRAPVISESAAAATPAASPASPAPAEAPTFAKASADKPADKEDKSKKQKVELKDIEEKLEEILKEQ
jgi:ribosomal protein S6